ncbi:Macrolide export ATP-binding/permease protein, partial [termite gut metagenome]
MRFDTDTWEEILLTITRNKTRSLLTAFGVFWGIFMLVALIGGAQGLQGLMSANFEGFATNSCFMWAQQTDKVYKGFQKGRSWNMEYADVERLRLGVPEIDVITPTINEWGVTAVYEENSSSCIVKGLFPDYDKIEAQE